MARVVGYGTAEIKPVVGRAWIKWRVWYFPHGKKETTLYTEHRSRRKAERAAEWYANAPHTQHNPSE